MSDLFPANSVHICANLGHGCTDKVVPPFRCDMASMESNDPTHAWSIRDSSGGNSGQGWYLLIVLVKHTPEREEFLRNLIEAIDWTQHWGAEKSKVLI